MKPIRDTFSVFISFSVQHAIQEICFSCWISSAQPVCCIAVSFCQISYCSEDGDCDRWSHGRYHIYCHNSHIFHTDICVWKLCI